MTAVQIDCSTGDETPYTPDPVALEDRKAMMWEDAKRIRDAHIDGGVTVPGIGSFDTDPMSRSNINGAVTGAVVANSLGQSFEVSWKLADNSVEMLDGAQMIAAGMGVLGHVAACHTIAQGLGLAIIAAEDHQALDAINLEAGWP